MDVVVLTALWLDANMILGVYSTLDKAVEAAHEYVEVQDSVEPMENWDTGLLGLDRYFLDEPHGQVDIMVEDGNLELRLDGVALDPVEPAREAT